MVRYCHWFDDRYLILGVEKVESNETIKACIPQSFTRIGEEELIAKIFRECDNTPAIRTSAGNERIFRWNNGRHADRCARNETQAFPGQLPRGFNYSQVKLDKSCSSCSSFRGSFFASTRVRARCGDSSRLRRRQSAFLHAHLGDKFTREKRTSNLPVISSLTTTRHFWLLSRRPAGCGSSPPRSLAFPFRFLVKNFAKRACNLVCRQSPVTGISLKGKRTSRAVASRESLAVLAYFCYSAGIKRTYRILICGERCYCCSRGASTVTLQACHIRYLFSGVIRLGGKGGENANEPRGGKFPQDTRRRARRR